MIVCLILMAGITLLSPVEKNALAQTGEGTIAFAGMNITPDMITWQPLVNYASLTLTVGAPSGATLTRSFDSDNNPTLAVGELPGDGLYSYELRLSPILDAKTQASLQAVADDPEARAQLVDDLTTAGMLPAVASQSGTFTVLGRLFVIPVEGEVSASLPSGTSDGGNTINDVLHYDDVIVTGSLCVGFDCVDGESFSFDTLKMKENNLQIYFDDTSTSAGFPANDWRLIANDSSSGGANYFKILDSTNSREPFKIMAGARTSAFYISNTGRIGFGTSTPVLDLHIAHGNTPGIRLDQDGSGGWGTYVWDVAGNEANFFIRDVTGSNRLPFRIRPGAPTSSIDISAIGNVGMGTASPYYDLEVSNTGQNTAIVAQRTDGATAVLSAITDTVQIGSLSNHPVEMIVNNTPVITMTGEGEMTLQGAAGVRAGLSAISSTVQIGALSNHDVELLVNSNPVASFGEGGMTLQGAAGGATAEFSAGDNTVQIGSLTNHDVEMVVNDTVVMTVTGAGNMTLQGALSEYSDVNVKENFAEVDGYKVLDRLDNIPVMTWNYIHDDSETQHMGPMAQDFYAAFELGADDRHIAALDVNGVSLAAIQTLNKISTDQKTQIEKLSSENTELKEKVDDLETRLSKLEQAAGNGAENQSNGFLVWSLVIVIMVVGAIQAALMIFRKMKQD